MSKGYGSIVIKNPGAKHSLAVGILNRLHLTIEGSLGYFGCGLIDGPNIHIKGRVGWSCAENMLAGTVVIGWYAESATGAALRGETSCAGRCRRQGRYRHEGQHDHHRQPRRRCTTS